MKERERERKREREMCTGHVVAPRMGPGLTRMCASLSAARGNLKLGPREKGICNIYIYFFFICYWHLLSFTGGASSLDGFVCSFVHQLSMLTKH